MNRPTVIALATAALLGASAYAAEDRQPDKNPAASRPGMGTMGMEKRMAQMQEQMERIRKTADPKERQKLMQEHMQSMQEGMKMMRGMGGSMMMGMMGGQKGGMGPGTMGDPKQQQEMMRTQVQADLTGARRYRTADTAPGRGKATLVPLVIPKRFNDLSPQPKEI
jgi:hypothetical protein